jgi:2-methylcitrate dehydratase PrpD
VVWGLDADRQRDALALAASNAGGIFENFRHHGQALPRRARGGGRRHRGGDGSGTGLRASATASRVRRGMLRAFSPQGRVDLATPAPEPGHWQIARRRLNIKKYPVVGAAQRCIDAMLALRRAGARTRPTWSSIVAHVSERHAAVMPYHLPQDALQAKFSLEYAMVGTLVHGAMGFDQLQDDWSWRRRCRR